MERPVLSHWGRGGGGNAYHCCSLWSPLSMKCFTKVNRKKFQTLNFYQKIPLLPDHHFPIDPHPHLPPPLTTPVL